MCTQSCADGANDRMVQVRRCLCFSQDCQESPTGLGFTSTPTAAREPV